MFIDKTEFIWNNWQEKIHDKLKINVNHFNNSRAILFYIYFKIINNIIKLTLIKWQKDCNNLNKTINNLLEELG